MRVTIPAVLVRRRGEPMRVDVAHRVLRAVGGNAEDGHGAADERVSEDADGAESRAAVHGRRQPVLRSKGVQRLMHVGFVWPVHLLHVREELGVFVCAHEVLDGARLPGGSGRAAQTGTSSRRTKQKQIKNDDESNRLKKS